MKPHSVAFEIFHRVAPFGRLLLAAAIAGCISGKAVAQAPAPSGNLAQLKAALQGDLNAYLRARSVSEHLSALSLTVSLGKDRPAIDLTAGTTQFHGGLPTKATDLYQIGSNTKAFTALAILQLEAQGRLSIDAPIGDYLPEYAAFRKLTLRRLLNMTSGLESYDNTPSWERSYAENPTANVAADTLIRLVYPKLKFQPGAKYHYSNTGYLLAQRIVDARSASKSFAKELARIFAGAGLKNTFYTSNVYPPSVAHRVVAGYYGNNDNGFEKFTGQDMTRYSLSWAQGAGAIVSTPQDLATWVRALYQGTALLPEKQKKELLSLVSVKTAKPLAHPTANDPAGFGLGVAERFDPKLGAFWFYQGETLGFRAAHLYFPKSDLVVCVFANSRPTESNSKLQELFKTIDASIKAAGYNA
jgi:D-alanyl-D-alanine carboxypeptidase